MRYGNLPKVTKLVVAEVPAPELTLLATTILNFLVHILCLKVFIRNWYEELSPKREWLGRGWGKEEV